MKIVDTAKITDMARIISFVTMLAYAALLFIRFISGYLSCCVEYIFIHLETIFNCAYARKRVINKVVHDRKYTVFAGNPDSGQGYPGNENQCIGMQW